MTRKQIDQARETRLWIRDIIIPIVGIMAMSPQAREVVVTKYNEAKKYIDTKFKKEK